MEFRWGAEVTRRETGIPFLMYSPRRTHMADLLLDAHAVDGPDPSGPGRASDDLRRDVLRDRRPRPRNCTDAACAPATGCCCRPRTPPSGSSPCGPGSTRRDRGAGQLLVERGRGGARRCARRADPGRRRRRTPGARTRGRGPLGHEEVLTAESGEVPAHPETDEDYPALIVFTAGTTGAAKGVTLAHRSVIANIHNLLVSARRLPHQIDPAARAGDQPAERPAVPHGWGAGVDPQPDRRGDRRVPAGPVRRRRGAGTDRARERERVGCGTHDGRPRRGASRRHPSRPELGPVHLDGRCPGPAAAAREAAQALLLGAEGHVDHLRHDRDRRHRRRRRPAR